MMSEVCFGYERGCGCGGEVEILLMWEYQLVN